MGESPKDKFPTSLVLLTIVLWALIVFGITKSDSGVIEADFGSKFKAIVYFTIASPVIALFVWIMFPIGEIFFQMGKTGKDIIKRILSFIMAATIFVLIVALFYNIVTI